ncbi:GMP reductase 1 isoform X2 [Molossus molossus]|uniref:GMP reductase 1 isoform X2 n=1 Tax=Molossus molossus TaxID=27622 RepID=UPI001746181A|nr:GMP reductase 1 isoform X2 [Molossus molossus]
MPRIDADLKLDFKDVLLRPKRSSLKSRAEVDLERTFTFRNSKQTYSGIPIIVANMDTVGTFEMAAVMSQHSMFTAVHKHYTLDDWKLFATSHPECLQHVAVSSGSGKNDLEKMSSILEAVPQVKFICLDVANGYSEHFVEFVKLVRAKFPEHTIMAGNVVTGEMVEELILSGADVIKVGVGPGSVCTTRTKTGVGYPQLSAVIECADSAHGLKGHIISLSISACGGWLSGPALRHVNLYNPVCTLTPVSLNTACDLHLLLPLMGPSGWRLHVSRRCRQSLWSRSRFRHAGRDVFGPHRVCWRGDREGRAEAQALLWDELRNSHEEACRRGSGVQSLRGQDCGSALQRGCGKHDSGYSWGTEVYVHLRGGRQAQGAQQEDDVHPGDPAAQHGVQLSMRTGPVLSWKLPRTPLTPVTSELGLLRRRDAAPPPGAWRPWGAPSCLGGLEAEH